MLASPRILALALLLALCSPTPARAQAPADSDSESDAALVLLRADSARALLVQPPGEKGASFAHFVRAPFHLLGATIALGAAAGYAAFQLLDETGILSAGSRLGRELKARDIHLRPDMIGSRSWPALVVRVEDPDPLFLEAGISLRGYTLLRGGLALGDTLTGLDLAGTRHDMNRLLFWGVGPDSDPADRADYRLTRRDATLTGWAPLAPHVRLRLGGGWEEDVVDRGKDDRWPDVQDVFTATLSSEPDRFARADAELRLDFTRVDGNYQLKGTRLVTGWRMYRGLDDTDARFQIGDADLRIFAPLDRRHAIALRGIVAGTWGEEGDGIPFYHLPTLGKDEGLRGFHSWRFRDRALAAAMAEWRYQVWYHPGDPTYRLDAMVFVDHGMVAPGLDKLARRDFETTPGFGLRLMESGLGMVQAFVAFGGDKAPRWGLDLGSSF